MVTAVTFREPALLVKAVTTVHALSGGRAWLGIGAGYHEEEAHAMGVPLPPVAERFDRLEETLRIARHRWSGDESPYEGTHYHLARPTSHPRPESPDRRHRGTPHPAPRGPLRRRVQRLRHPRRRSHRTQEAVRPGQGVREDRPPLRRDRKTPLHLPEPGRIRNLLHPPLRTGGRMGHRPRRRHHRRPLDPRPPENPHHGRPRPCRITLTRSRG
ncbi:LLM class flavin-dependent oxidoreductase [Nonomuraea sp. NPDC050547]|uniref:LLM class flavin-dependent oxidoreductase n=1 Tax=Nonomuraea sp. NPDC050547 TaxID=3364368 RepID=UPI003798D9A9